MKKKLIVLCLLLLGAEVYAQQVYKGQLDITDKDLSVSKGKLHVGMSVNYENLQLSSNESLTLTPLLKSEKCVLELPPMVVNGCIRQRVYHRKQVLSSKQRSRLKPASASSAPAVVAKNNRKKVRQLAYNIQVPYLDWMEGASLVLRTSECGCNGKPAGIYEDKIAEGVKMSRLHTSSIGTDIDSCYLALTNIVPLVDGEDTLHVQKGCIPYWGSNGLDQLSTGKQDYEICFRLREAIHSLEHQSGLTVTRLKVMGYGSPEGDYRKNEKVSLRRALALKDYLRENYVAGNVPFEVNWVAEDWDSIRTLVRDSNMPLRQAVADIINTVDLTKGRERTLLKLADGAPYKYLVEYIFPKVRRVEYSIDYVQHHLGTAEGRRLFEMGSRSLKLSEFFAVAMSYPKGSNEYNDAFDLAARLFPDSPEAAINAAAVALSKRDVKKARAYLEKYATLPLAYNNMGILYLLEGNRDKAEVYLQMAAANGVKEARQALTYLRKQVK
ncbi:MAG: DUF3868 domain-containing protein [Bacteroides sp.]|jgi:hypothetical protein|nr:DUF3868 domain-containing protein [Bacteroides sp.]